ncbi:MAG: cobyric acid synthase [Chloroflexi bacterium]|nr:cobyric acid synthase [Chloroflexota bacterium]
MKAKVLMVQGTASSVGKSVVVAALCRIFKQDGLRVAPFKAQNMALNSFVTPDGGEIGRAQAVQAEAACIAPSVDMNPILLKPETDGRSQIVVLGRPRASLAAKDYYARQAELWSIVKESFARLSAKFDLIIIEGAGSPAEVNLKASEIVNMRVARHASAPVVLVGDVDKGGVFAALVGTLELLDAEERDLVKGFIINKFRGDLSLLRPGLDFLENRTNKRVIGVIPYYRDAQVAQEDSVYLETRPTEHTIGATIDIAVLWLPHISNFDDFDPLDQEDGVRVRYVRDVDQLGSPDLIIIPGTKSTMADLFYLRSNGLAECIVDFARRGKPVIGICGGYQMLGKEMSDPEQVESEVERMVGLGLLPIGTRFEATKVTRQVRGRVLCNRGLFDGCAGVPVVGYEIHMGDSGASETEHVFEIVDADGSIQLDGAVSRDGTVFGTYLHGIFDNAEFRRTLLSQLARRKGQCLEFERPLASREQQYDRLADTVRGSLDVGFLRAICGL